MARMNYVDPEQAHWLAKEILARRNNRNIHRMLGHSGHVADAFVRLAVTLRYESILAPAMREIAIIRVGGLSGATYEVHAHRRICRRMNILTDDQMDAVVAGDANSDALSPTERRVLAFTDELVNRVKASDETFDPLLAAIGEKALVELVITIGYYMSVCRFLETFEVDIDEDSR